MRKVAFISLWLYVFTLSGEHSIDFEGGIGSVTRVVGILALLAGLIAVAMRGSMRRITAFHTKVIAFYLLVVASFFWSADSDATAKAIRTFAQAMWVVWLIWEFAPETLQRRHLMLAYISGGCVSAILTVRESAISIIARGGTRFSADGWNQNDMAIALALGVPFATLLISRQNKVTARLAALGYLLLAPVAIVLTASRGGAITLAIAGLSVPMIAGRGSVVRRFTALGLFATLIICLVIVTPDKSWNRLATIGAESTGGNLNDRLPIWQSGLRTFASTVPNAIFGVGADGFLHAVGLGFVAHNTYLSVLVNYGLIGFTVFLFLLANVATAAFRADHSERLALAFCLVCWMVGVVSLTWEAQRSTWFLFGLIGTAASLPASLQPLAPEFQVSGPLVEV